MSQEIHQLHQKINSQDILERKFYPVWFFTNERINYFFPEIEQSGTMKKVFSIMGSGDMAFSLLSRKILNIEELKVCDIRPMACLTVDLKINLLKSLKYEEFLNLFLGKVSFDKNQIYNQIEKSITPITRKIIKFILEERSENDFLKCLKASKLWYKDSFWQIKRKKDYLPYLNSEENYQFLQNNLDKITIYFGDFNENLKTSPDDFYDFIYLSNILDSKNYCSEPELCLAIVKKKLKKDGLLFIVTLESSKKKIRFLEKSGFSIFQKQFHRFNIFSSLLGHYDYSFLLLKKNS